MQKLDVEKVVLSALLLEEDSYFKIKSLINPHCFKNSCNRLIYESIKALHDNNDVVDMLTVMNHLESRNKLKEAGDYSYISDVASKISNAVNVEKYAMILADNHSKEYLIKTLKNEIDNLFSGGDPFDSISNINKITENIVSHSTKFNRGIELEKAVYECTDRYMNRKEFRFKGIYEGLETLSQALTTHTIGWGKEWLIIIAGRPGMGKTAFALAEARSQAMKGGYPCFFSLEMGNESLVDRLMINQMYDMDSSMDPGLSKRFAEGTMSHREEQLMHMAYDQLKKTNLYIDDNPSCDIDYIRSICKKRKIQNRCTAIFIDYLQLMKVEKNVKIREQQIAQASRGLKLLAKELKVPIFLLAQLNREVERDNLRLPNLSHLRESGSLEQDADMVIFPWRPGYYAKFDKKFIDKVNDAYSDKFPNLDWERVCLLIIAKDRHRGIAQIPLYVNMSCTEFKDI